MTHKNEGPLCHPRPRDERGQVTFEFLMVFPLIFLFIYLMVEGVVFVEQWTTLDNAVREGARYAAVGHKAADIKTCVAYWSGNNLSTGNVGVSGATDSSPAGTAGGTVTVGVGFNGAASYSYNFTSGLAGLTKSISLNPKTSTRLETSTVSTNGSGSPCGT